MVNSKASDYSYQSSSRLEVHIFSLLVQTINKICNEY